MHSILRPGFLPWNLDKTIRVTCFLSFFGTFAKIKVAVSAKIIGEITRISVGLIREILPKNWGKRCLGTLALKCYDDVILIQRIRACVDCRAHLVKEGVK